MLHIGPGTRTGKKSCGHVHHYNKRILRNIRCRRSEEHTSELQSRPHLVRRLLLEKKHSTKISASTGTDFFSSIDSSPVTPRSSLRLEIFPIPSSSSTALIPLCPTPAPPA